MISDAKGQKLYRNSQWELTVTYTNVNTEVLSILSLNNKRT